jgi:hypothetical protein
VRRAPVRRCLVGRQRPHLADKLTSTSSRQRRLHLVRVGAPYGALRSFFGLADSRTVRGDLLDYRANPDDDDPQETNVPPNAVDEAFGGEAAWGDEELPVETLTPIDVRPYFANRELYRTRGRRQSRRVPRAILIQRVPRRREPRRRSVRSGPRRARAPGRLGDSEDSESELAPLPGGAR